MTIKHVVSVSGGKDSTATLLLAIDRFGRDRVLPIFCDTGNEHEAVYEYLDYLEDTLDVQIHHLRANFDTEIATKRIFIAQDARTRREYDSAPVFDANDCPVWQRTSTGKLVTKAIKVDGEIVELRFIQKQKKVGGGRRVRWTNKAKRRALAVLQPTGNPYLDLCLWKGRFPSRKRQFCTEELKRNPAVSFQLDLIDAGHTVISWQGIRRDESLNRRNALKFEKIAPSLYIFRPIVEWTATDVFSFCADHRVKPNPLYLQGMGRVGCMPCINANKAEFREIAARFPAHIARIAEWEKQVALASKRMAATFVPAPGITPRDAPNHDIFSVIEWSKTSRGGRQFDMLAELIEPSACASMYGLCG